MNDNIFKELDRRILTTATNRFNASSRLNKHNKFSLWTVMYFSLILILVSIFNMVNVQPNVNPSFVNASSIFLSVVILTISTALSMSNFGARAEKFLDCGRELHALSFNFKKIINDTSLQTNENYEKYQKDYEHILSRYENHKLIDHLYTKLLWKDSYNPKFYNYIATYLRYFFEYFIYFLLFITVSTWMYYTYI
jgi:uncharacterized integral membrane protein